MIVINTFLFLNTLSASVPLLIQAWKDTWSEFADEISVFKGRLKHIHEPEVFIEGVSGACY